MPASLHFRLADGSEVTTLHSIRQEAIRRLTLTHLSECEAATWAESGGIPRVERAVAKDEVWVAMIGRHVVGWLHRAGNSIEGLYVLPAAARQGVGAALVRVAERQVAREGHRFVVLGSSSNAVEFYQRLGYVAAGGQSASGAIAMRKAIETT